MKKILIQLIGHQTIPNVVPLFVLHPDEVWHLCTTETLQTDKRIAKWLQSNPQMAHVVHRRKKINTLDKYEETMNCCLELMQQHPDAQFIVNMTGGTKLMSLGAYLGAVRHGNTPVVYVDPYRSKDYADLLVWVEGADMKAAVCTEYDPSSKLGVKDFLALGEQAQILQSTTDWHRLLPAAKAVQQYADSLKDKKWSITPLLKQVKQNKILQTSFKEAKVEFDFSHSDGGVRGHSFLTGNWWEILVADYLERSGRFIDVACSVDTKISEKAGSTETDVLATDGITLTSISCKRHLQKPDSEINKHESRSRKLGGTLVHCGLAVYDFPNLAALEALEELAAVSHFELISGHHICAGKPKPKPPVPAHTGDKELDALFPKMKDGLAGSFLSPRPR